MQNADTLKQLIATLWALVHLLMAQLAAQAPVQPIQPIQAPIPQAAPIIVENPELTLQSQCNTNVEPYYIDISARITRGDKNIEGEPGTITGNGKGYFLANGNETNLGISTEKGIEFRYIDQDSIKSRTFEVKTRSGLDQTITVLCK